MYIIYATFHPCHCMFKLSTANLRTTIMDFRGFDSSIILISRRGILMSLGNYPESLSQRILVGIILVWGLGVLNWNVYIKGNKFPPTASYSIVTKQAVIRGLLTKWVIPMVVVI